MILAFNTSNSNDRPLLYYYPLRSLAPVLYRSYIRNSFFKSCIYFLRSFRFASSAFISSSCATLILRIRSFLPSCFTLQPPTLQNSNNARSSQSDGSPHCAAVLHSSSRLRAPAHLQGICACAESARLSIDAPFS